jgi:uncharacterized membrane protein YoaK (UPF0700 family)
MITEDRNALILAISLAALAGFVDAIGFIKLGGFFISFMSGNSTRFAVGFTEYGLAAAAIIPLALIILFVIGVMIGALINHFYSQNHVHAVLLFVTSMLLLAALAATAGQPPLAVLFMVVAMGAENNIFVKGGQVHIGVTYMTGTLVKIGQKLAAGFLGKPKRECLPFIFLWLGLVGGALMGAFCYNMFGFSSLWIATCFSGAILFTVSLRNRKI